MDLSVRVNIEETLKQSVEVALVEALAKQGPAITQEIVRLALAKKSSANAKETLLAEAIGVAIRFAVRKQVDVWLASNQEAIQAMVAEEAAKILSPQLVAINTARQLAKMSMNACRPFAHVTEESEDDDE